MSEYYLNRNIAFDPTGHEQAPELLAAKLGSQWFAQVLSPNKMTHLANIAVGWLEPLHIDQIRETVKAACDSIQLDFNKVYICGETLREMPE